MNPLKTSVAIAKALRANSAFNGVYLYAHDREISAGGAETDLTGPSEEGEVRPQIRLPHVGVIVKTAEPLCGSPTIGMMKVEIWVNSQFDTDSPATHEARCTAVRAVMVNSATLGNKFAGEGISLLGDAKNITNDPTVEARHFSTPMTYQLGCESPG